MKCSYPLKGTLHIPDNSYICHECSTLLLSENYYLYIPDITELNCVFICEACSLKITKECDKVYNKKPKPLMDLGRPLTRTEKVMRRLYPYKFEQNQIKEKQP